MIKALLFDLDGTLLQMDSYKFANHYVKLLVEAMAAACQHPNMKQLVLQGIDNMLKNTSVTNRQAFFKDIVEQTGVSEEEFEEKLIPFYRDTYPTLKDMYCMGVSHQAVQIVKRAKAKGLKTALATNPLFPRGATVARLQWAGLSEEDFDEITSFEEYRAAKPRKEYFLQILDRMGLKPEECVFIGNDCSDDLSAGKLGIQTYWLTEWPINLENVTPEFDYTGKLEQLAEWIEEL